MTIEVFTQDAPLSPAPIRREWVLEGAPAARNTVLARSADRTALTMLWDCTAGRFRWVYDQDETIHVIEGSATLTLSDGRIKTLGPGDVVFFPAGTSAIWEVGSYVRKFAVFREPVPTPLALLLRTRAKLRQALSSARAGRPAFPAVAYQPQAA